MHNADAVAKRCYSHKLRCAGFLHKGCIRITKLESLATPHELRAAFNASLASSLACLMVLSPQQPQTLLWAAVCVAMLGTLAEVVAAQTCLKQLHNCVGKNSLGCVRDRKCICCYLQLALNGVIVSLEVMACIAPYAAVACAIVAVMCAPNEYNLFTVKVFTLVLALAYVLTFSPLTRLYM